MPAEALYYANLSRLKVSEALLQFYPGRRRNSFGNLAHTLEVLLSFGDRATGEHIFPSIGEVSRITGSCYRTIQRHLVELEERGILKKMKAAVWSLCLPYEFALTRDFAVRLLKVHFGHVREKMQRTRLFNSLKLLERTLLEEARSIPWRRKNKKPGPPPRPRSAGKAGPVEISGVSGQHGQLPPSLRSGERTSGGPDGFAAGPSPLDSLTSPAPAGASPAAARSPTSWHLLDILKRIRSTGY